MKEFMMIFMGADYGALGLSPQELQARMGKWWAWHGKMEQAGILRSGHALESPITRIAGPDRTVSNHTAAEIKEIVGGYYVIEVENLEAAMAEAQDFPDYDLGGTVEVREVMVFEQ